MIWNETDQSGTRSYQAADLKICDLCGALNLAANKECFICRWQGRFERRPEVVTIAMDLLERKHGGLDPSLISDSLSGISSPGSGFRAKITHFLNRLWGHFMKR